jgi:hypothetical protein
VRQKLCRRLEELERTNAASAARRADHRADYKSKIADIIQNVQAWHADPVNQKLVQEQPPEYLGIQVRALRQRLVERAYGGAR